MALGGRGSRGRGGVDSLVATAWRYEGEVRARRDAGGRRMGDSDRFEDKAFVWRHGRAEVTLSHDGAGWYVIYTTVGKLLGPRQVLYEARHKRAMHAAWDVMARVIRASRDEDEGLRAARAAARWMRAGGILDETDD